MSILQDIIYCTTNGHIRTCKHLALPLTVRQLTRSEQVVHLLNQFGHGCSSSKLLEYETALAEDLIRQNESEDCHIPSNIDPDLPVIFCWDNNDLIEETLTGKGTTHCTNGIVVQRKLHTNSQANHHPRERKRQTKRRSLKMPVALPLQYNAGIRCGPCTSIIGDSARHPHFDLMSEAFLKDLLWVLLRLDSKHSVLLGRSEEDQQAVPGWSGFNAVVTSAVLPVKSTVGYLPIIPESPTSLAAVYELLVRSCSLASRVGQDHVIITVDQAIYCKAQEVVWKHSEQFKQVVLRMGAFHTACAFLAVIGKRFGDAGLHDLLIESGVLGSSAADSVLSGKHYNRVHKLMFEALKWRACESLLTDDNNDAKESLQDLGEQLIVLRQEDKFFDVMDLLKSGGFDIFSKAITQCIEAGVMSTFWQSYLDMVSRLLTFLRATREGDCEFSSRFHSDSKRIRSGFESKRRESPQRFRATVWLREFWSRFHSDSLRDSVMGLTRSQRRRQTNVFQRATIDSHLIIDLLAIDFTDHAVYKARLQREAEDTCINNIREIIYAKL